MEKFVSVLAGSFNPPHVGHLSFFDEILEEREKLYLFVRYNEGVDLVSREIKQKWFDRISAERDNRLIVNLFSAEDFKGKVYDGNTIAMFIPRFESILGETINEVWVGEDEDSVVREAEKMCPNVSFRVIKRLGISSTVIRNDLEGHKDYLPDYIYEDLIAARLEAK